MARTWFTSSQLRVRVVKPPPAGERMISAPRRATMRATSGVHISEQTTMPMGSSSRTKVPKRSAGETSSPSPSSVCGMVAGWVRS